jgi:hypothetical protein
VLLTKCWFVPTDPTDTHAAVVSTGTWPSCIAEQIVVCAKHLTILGHENVLERELHQDQTGSIRNIQWGVLLASTSKFVSTC